MPDQDTGKCVPCCSPDLLWGEWGEGRTQWPGFKPSRVRLFKHSAQSSVLGCPCPTAHHTALLLMLHLSWPLGTAPMSCEVRVRSGTEQDGGLMAPSPHSQHAFDLCEWLFVDGPWHLEAALPGPCCLDQYVVLWRDWQVGCLGLIPTALGWSWSTETSMSLLRHHL